MARPAGQFTEQRDRFYQILKRLAGFQGTTATNPFLAKIIGRTKHQINRYLKSLVADKFITVSTSKGYLDKQSGTWYRKRVIKLVGHEGPVERGWMMPATPLPECLPAQQTIIDTSAIDAAISEMKADQKRRAEDIARFAEMNTDMQFDRAAVLRELKEELAKEGITLEL